MDTNNESLESTALECAQANCPAPYIPPRDPLQQQLVLIWEEILRKPGIGIWDTFRLLGGNNGHQSEILTAVSRRCGASLPAEALAADSTIETLADRIVAQLPRGRTRQIQPGDGSEREPLFFLSGDFAGGGIYSIELARAIGSDWPFYLLQQHGLNGMDVKDSIESMADDHLEELLRLHPVGPYLIGGHCNGALIALDVAQKLIAMKKNVDALMLIDVPVEAADTKHPETKTSTIALRPLEPRQDSLRARKAWNLRQYLSCIRRYTASFYPGRITFFWSADHAFKNKTSRERWKHIAQDAQFRAIPGNHKTCVTQYVDFLGSEIHQCLPQKHPQMH